MRTPNRLSALLRDTRGDVNLREEVLALPVSVKIFAVAATLFLLVMTLISGVSATAASSGRYNVNSLQFEREVNASTLIKGIGADALAILTNTASGACTVKVWESVNADGKQNLLTRSTTIDSPCAATTAAARFAAADGTVEVANLQKAAFSIENLGGRTITYAVDGSPTLASGSQPEKVSDADWNDLRAYRITLDLTSATERVGKYAKSRTYVGTTRVANVPQADPDLHYVPPAKPISAPSAVKIESIVRSTTTGTAYSGAREGVTVSISGGVCEADPTKLTIAITPTAPAGLATVSTTTLTRLTGAAFAVELAGIPNGSDSTVTATASCGDGGSMTVKDQRTFHQAVPAPTLYASMGTRYEQHVLSWTAVSSLPASYKPSWTSTLGTSNEEAATASTSMLVRFAVGSTFGGTFTYNLTATVNGDTAQAKPAVYSALWPAAPAAQSISYTRTGYSGNFVSGTVKWSYANTCPDGTTLQAQQLENRTGQSNGTISSTVNYTGPWTANLTSVNWSPSYATQAYAYGMGVNTRCLSPNGLSSPVVTAQSANWITAWTTPATPVWDAYNYRDWVRGTNWTYSTCLTAGCASMTVDYKTFCPAGTWVSWSNWVSQSWTGATFAHPIGYQDNWQLPAGVNASAVYYRAAEYTCASPWSSASPHSPQSGTVGVTVQR